MRGYRLQCKATVQLSLPPILNQHLQPGLPSWQQDRFGALFSALFSALR